MKAVVTVPYRDRMDLSDTENKIRNARNSNDYILVYFGNKGQFIKMSFHRDQTYTIGFNFINMEFQVKLNYMMKQYPKIVNGKLAAWLVDWVNKLNR